MRFSSIPDHPYGFDEIWARAFDPATKEYYKFLVARPQELRQDVVYPKESSLIEDVQNELRLGRRCQVYATYTGEKDVNGRLERGPVGRGAACCCPAGVCADAEAGGMVRPAA